MSAAQIVRGLGAAAAAVLLVATWPQLLSLHRVHLFAQLTALRETVDEVGRVDAEEGLGSGFVKGGALVVARTPAQEQRARASVARAASWGERTEWLDAARTLEHLAAAGARGATFTPDCARVHPAKLVAGVARAVRERGVRIHEGTRATRIGPGVVVTDRGTVRAPVVLRCLEGFTAGLPGHRREWLPMNSAIIATAPQVGATPTSSTPTTRVRPSFQSRRSWRRVGTMTAIGAKGTRESNDPAGPAGSRVGDGWRQPFVRRSRSVAALPTRSRRK